MVLKYTRKRVYRRKRRTYKKRMMGRVRRIVRSPRVTQIQCKRTLHGGTWTFGTATVNDFWRYFTYTITSFNGFSEMSSVFDEYKVNAIKVTFRPSYDSIQNVTAAGTLIQPQAYAHVIVDPASTIIPTGTYTLPNLNTFLENEGVRTYTLNRPFSVYYRPKTTSQIAGSGTGSVMRGSPWVRTSDTGAQYRGFHMFLQQNNFSTGNTNISLDVFITFYCSFRNLK